jgi:hypothetical protein
MPRNLSFRPLKRGEIPHPLKRVRNDIQEKMTTNETLAINTFRRQ